MDDWIDGYMREYGSLWDLGVALLIYIFLLLRVSSGAKAINTIYKKSKCN